MNTTQQGIAHYLGEECLVFFKEITVGIAGAGGLGSNCAMHLVRSGFHRFVIVDFDKVESSNLNRQAFFADQIGEYKVDALSRNMQRVNPAVDVTKHILRAGPEHMKPLFGGCDVVVEAFDSAEVKKALVETLLPTSVLVVAASGMGGSGNSDAMVIRRVRENFYLVGDGETECTVETPPLSPKVNIAAAKQADVVLSYFLERFKDQGGTK